MLTASANGTPVSSSDAWTELLKRGAVEGTPAQPAITAIGRHVLAELETRAYRTDSWPLDRLADELTRVLSEVEGTAKNAQYFLSDLGPITPAEAVPYLRIVSVGLANRRETPEDLAERFRQVWGMVEVMGGDSRDRLVGAELLIASAASMSQLYAPMMTTVESLRSLGASRAVSSAAILHLESPGVEPAALERWQSARAIVPNDEAAALLATIMGKPEQLRAFEEFRRLLANQPMGGRTSAALYLASQSVDPSEGIDRVLETARLLAPRTRRPLLTASLLTAEHPLSPAELVDWVLKAAEAAARCQLASQPDEFLALGIALVEGLPRATFASEADKHPEASKLADATTLLALHSWVYRPLLDPAFEREVAPTPPTTSP
ncbi:MAG: hypothetical protein L3J99_02445 [Thermoplasmata archaeon]|nr:hypothetical protein [Thermoplasmata archaeon]